MATFDDGTLLTFIVHDKNGEPQVGAFIVSGVLDQEDAASTYLAHHTALSEKLVASGLPVSSPSPGAFIAWLLDEGYIKAPKMNRVWSFEDANDFDPFENK